MNSKPREFKGADLLTGVARRGGKEWWFVALDRGLCVHELLLVIPLLGWIQRIGELLGLAGSSWFGPLTIWWDGVHDVQ